MRRAFLLTATVLSISTGLLLHQSFAFAGDSALEAACRANEQMPDTQANSVELAALRLVSTLGQSPSYTLEISPNDSEGHALGEQRIIPDGRVHNLVPKQPIDLKSYHLTTLAIHGSPADLAFRSSDVTDEKALALRESHTIDQLDLAQTDNGDNGQVKNFQVVIPPEPFLRGPTHPFQKTTFAIVACSDTDAKAFVATVYTSNFWGAVIYTLLAAASIWLGAALPFAANRRALRKQDRGRKNLCWLRGLDPVVITQDGFGFGSVARLQVFFFTLIVVATLTYVFLRTGCLSEISENTLLLLGISGLGSTASTLVSKTRVSNKQEISFVTERWLTRHGITFPSRSAKWGDLVVSGREFDVYKFQALVFSALVGCWILSSGLNNLANLTIPPHVMALLGLSQCIYVGGKAIVGPGSGRRELNNAVVRTIESETALLSLLPPGHPYRIEARSRGVACSLGLAPSRPTATVPAESTQALEQFQRNAYAAMTLANTVLNGRNKCEILPVEPPDDTLTVTVQPRPTGLEGMGTVAAPA